jgi:hypothetical protein
MIKIPTVFKRDPSNMSRILCEVTPGCEWVISGEGIATRKFDGTCVLVRGGRMFKRYDAKHGKTPPPDFEPAQPAPDPVTGHWPGWVPVGEGPDDRWHRDAFGAGGPYGDGTYELCGPRIQKNPEGFSIHILVRHGTDILHTMPRDFGGLQRALCGYNIEGVVWHHPDGRMAKVKGRDFGYVRSTPA